MGFDADLTACAALVEKADPDRFAAVMACDLPAREILFPLYAFNVEISRAPWVTQESMIAEMRLQWWRDALEEIGAGGVVRRHEVVTPLSRVLPSQLAAVLDRSVAARRWDIYKDAFEDKVHFDTYIDDTAAGLMWTAAVALGTPDTSRAEKTVRAIGRAAGLARFLIAVPELEAQKRVPLVDGRPEAIAALAASALADWPDRATLADAIPTSARPALREAFLARNLLNQVAKSPGLVAQGALSVSPLKRSLLLWRGV